MDKITPKPNMEMYAGRETAPFCSNPSCTADGKHKVLGAWYCSEHFLQLARAKADSIERCQHPSAERFDQAVRRIVDLSNKKRQDYGSATDPFANVRASEEWGTPAWVGTMMRANDKMHRLQAYAKRGTLANESVEDSLLDIAVYSIIALVLYEEGQ